MLKYERHRNYRVLSPLSDVCYFGTSAEAERFATQVSGRIECYVWGYGWVRWLLAMREPEAVE